jgi:ATP-dependent Clp protease ATP-binding subunit ClpB
MNHLIRGSEHLASHEGFELVGRDAELQRLVSVLMRSRASSVILVGPGGVGCTALCLGVQAAKMREDAPFDLVSKRLFWLDTNSLFSSGDGAATNGSFHRIVQRVERSREGVLIIEDARDFIEGCRSNNVSHFINGLILAVQNNRMQVIFETKDEDLDLVVRSHSDVKELFTILPIEEPGADALTKIVASAARGLTHHHGIRIADDAIATAIELTNRYQSRDSGLSRAQPERSITLLDRTLATYRLDVHRNPPGVPDWEEQQRRLRKLHDEQRAGEMTISSLEEQIDHIKSTQPENTRLAVLGQFETPEIMDLHEKVRLIQREVDVKRAEFAEITVAVNSSLLVTRDLVLGEFSDISGIPASKLNQDDVEKLRGLDAALARRIFGQEDAIRRLADGVRIARVGRRNNARPTSYLFLGPSGVGKTEMSKVLAGVLLDDEAALSRFDMSEYMEKHAVAKMIGAPPGYEGFEAGGILTNLMRRNGNRVLLFDEIEKAHPDIFNIMLQVLEDGQLTDNIGRTVSFSDAIIIMTTNIGQPHFLDETLSVEEAEARATDDLNTTYRSEFLNRFAGRQNIVCFKRLGLDSIEKIVRREIASINTAYGERGVTVSLDDASLSAFCEDRYDPRIGARGLPGFISANLEPIVVNAILANPELRDAAARVTYDRERRAFAVEF